MSRIPLILAWLTVGAWTAATVRVATSPDADLTPLALAITATFAVIALKITQHHEKEKEKNDAVR